MDITHKIEITEIRPKVLSTARKIFRASRLERDPEDVVQDVLLRLWVTRRDGVQIRNPEARAVYATKNGCISLWRKIGPARSGVCPEWLSDGRDASQLIKQSEAEKIADKALEQIVGQVFPENAASARVLEKNGFRLEKTKTGAVVKGGKAMDVRVYRLDF